MVMMKPNKPEENPTVESDVSYQNRSPCFKFENCLPRMQDNVGPARELVSGISVTIPVHKSISLGSLK